MRVSIQSLGSGGIKGLMTLATALATLGQAAAQDTNVSPSRIDLPEITNASPSCLSDGSKVTSLNQILVVENTSLYDERGLAYEVERDRLLYRDESGEMVGISLSYAFEELSGLDIELRFAVVGGETQLFWKETFLNRPAKFGLVSLETTPGKMRMICISEEDFSRGGY